MKVSVGDTVRGLSHRGEGIRHGKTVVVEGRVTKISDDGELWVQYCCPVLLDGERTKSTGGWFKESELRVL